MRSSALDITEHFTLTDKEKETLIFWKKLQPLESSYSYVFTPTGIGTSIQVVNIKTGKSINITDYESW